MMQQAKEAMARAQQLEDELDADRIPIDKGQIKAVFSGTGRLVSIKIDPELCSAEDVDVLEDMIVACVSDGFEKATEIRNSKVQAIMPNIPGL